MSDHAIAEHPDTAESILSRPSGAIIRQQKRRQRRLLSAAAQLQHSRQLSQHVTRDRLYRCSRNIACYIANDGEIDPFLIIEHAWLLRKKVYLPVLSPLQNSLYFAPFEANSKFRLNCFNIPEPVCHPSKWLKARQLDVLLLPLVAFDEQGNRMGMGGGYYDRTLAYLKHRQYRKKPLLAGLAHEVQKVPGLETQSWDIPLDYIFTEMCRYTATAEADRRPY